MHLIAWHHFWTLGFPTDSHSKKKIDSIRVTGSVFILTIVIAFIIVPVRDNFMSNLALLPLAVNSPICRSLKQNILTCVLGGTDTSRAHIKMVLCFHGCLPVFFWIRVWLQCSCRYQTASNILMCNHSWQCSQPRQAKNTCSGNMSPKWTLSPPSIENQTQ